MSHDLFQESISERPQVSLESAAAVARNHFDVAGSIRPLPSERDQNFLIQPPDGQPVVLKVANRASRVELLQAQNDAMRHVAESIGADRCATPLSSNDGRDLLSVDYGDGESLRTRLVTWLPGIPWAKFRPHRKESLHEAGRLMGRVAHALLSFENPAFDRVLRWDLARAPEVIDQCKSALPPDALQWVQEVRDDFDHWVAPRLDSLRKSIIHSDANDYNLIVDCRHASLEPRLGLIDFGDMVQTHTVNELAILLAYLMMGNDDPIGQATHVVAGFHEQLSLTAEEVEVLETLARLRMSTSVSLAYVQSESTDDDEYLRVSLAPALRCLRQLSGASRSLSHYRLRRACGWRPCPHSAPTAKWIEDHHERFSPILPWDLRGKSLEIVDLSVDGPGLTWSKTLEQSDGPTDDAEFEACPVRIGRYDEPRLCYAGDQFAEPGETARTIHIGIDLFAAAGTPVAAPIDGTIHSFADNDRPFDYGPTVLVRHATDDGTEFFTLYGHLSRESLCDLRVGMRVAAGVPFAALGGMDENGGWPPHLHFQWMADDLGLAGDFPGVAPPNERETWRSICPDPSRLAGLDPVRTVYPTSDPDELQSRRERVLGRSLSLSYRSPLHIVRGQGAQLYDSEGLPYLDLVNNVCHVGHCHPRVVQAACRQIPILNTNTRYLHENILDYAERLQAKFPAPLDVVFLVNSGSEANDLALRMARQVTGRADVVVLDAAYHGNLGSLIDVSPYKFKGPGGSAPPAHVHVASLPDSYRGRYRGATAHTARAYAEELSLLLDQSAAKQRPVGTFLCESLLGCGGQIELPPGYLEQVYQHVRERGGVCIADEVQVGFGRVGSHFWGFETQNVVPDIVTLGKPIGNGHPMGAVVTTQAVADAFANGMEYFNTFGGNPVSAAVGLAVLDVIEDEGLPAHALQVGGRMIDGLQQLKEKYPVIGDVRGRGLFIGVELVQDRNERTADAELATYVSERLRENRILISTDGPDHNVLKIKPPLVIRESDIDRVINKLDQVLAESPVSNL